MPLGRSGQDSVSSNPRVGKSSSKGRAVGRLWGWRGEGVGSGPSGEASGEKGGEPSSEGSDTEAGRKEQVGQHICGKERWPPVSKVCLYPTQRS